MVAYLVYGDGVPYAETGPYTQSGSLLLDYGVAFGVGLFVALKVAKYALVKRLPR
jgi:hypothetical protein